MPIIAFLHRATLITRRLPLLARNTDVKQGFRAFYCYSKYGMRTVALLLHRHSNWPNYILMLRIFVAHSLSKYQLRFQLHAVALSFHPKHIDKRSPLPRKRLQVWVFLPSLPWMISRNFKYWVTQPFTKSRFNHDRPTFASVDDIVHTGNAHLNSEEGTTDILVLID